MNNRSSQRGTLQFILLIVIAGVFLFAAWYIRSPRSPLYRDRGISAAEKSAKIEQGTKYLIEITDKGFVPTVLRVKPYDTVTFLNRASAEHWIISGDEDGNGGCEGFDSTRPLRQYETYARVFVREEVCSFRSKESNLTPGEISVSYDAK